MFNGADHKSDINVGAGSRCRWYGNTHFPIINALCSSERCNHVIPCHLQKASLRAWQDACHICRYTTRAMRDSLFRLPLNNSHGGPEDGTLSIVPVWPHWTRANIREMDRTRPQRRKPCSIRMGPSHRAVGRTIKSNASTAIVFVRMNSSSVWTDIAFSK